MDDALLLIRNLSIGFSNTQAVSQLDLTLEAGKTYALLGESGSGKSLTALALLGLLPEAAKLDENSELIFQGKNLAQLSEVDWRKIRGRKIGIIFQEPMTALNPVLTIKDQIEEVLTCHFNFSAKERYQRIKHLCEEVGLRESDQLLRQYPHELSGGMKQRVMIAMALAAEPELLIADEPTTALDVTIQQQVLKLLANLQKKNKMTLLFITHDLGVAKVIADEVAVMKKGLLVEQGSAEIVLSKPQHDYTRSLLAALPSQKKREEDAGLLANNFEQASTSAPLLSIQNLKVGFPIRSAWLRRTVGYTDTVKNVSFSLNPGETLAIVGESGSGKTTTAQTILGLIAPQSGGVYFENQRVDDLSGAALKNFRRNVQAIFQDPFSAMNPRMPVLDLLLEGLDALHLGSSSPVWRRHKAKELLAAVDLPEDSLERYPHEFSGGQRQRLCIARALAVEPRLIICDEPTSALDVSVQMQILRLLKKLQKERNMAYLFITHDLGVVSYFADFVAVMCDGRIVEHDTVDAVMGDPKEAYTQKLLAAQL